MQSAPLPSSNVFCGGIHMEQLLCSGDGTAVWSEKPDAVVHHPARRVCADERLRK